MKKSLAKNAIYKSLLNIFNLLVPLLVGPYISGLLLKEDYGIYNNALSWMTVFLTFGAFGIYQYGVREISRIREDQEKKNQLFTNLFLIGLIANIIASAIYILYFMSAAQSELEFTVYAVLTIQIIANIFYVEFINEADENYSFITIKTIVIRLCYLVSTFLFVKSPSDVVIYAIITSLTVFFNIFVSYLYLRRNIRFDFRKIEITRHIFPLIIAFVLTNTELLYSQLDKLMLGEYVSKISVTEYVQPYTLVQMVASIPLALVSVAIPRLSQYIGTNHQKDYNKVLKNTTNIYMCMVIPISFGILVLAEEIMWLYTRDMYTYAYPVLIITAIGRIIFAYQAIINNLIMYINGLERQMVLFSGVFGVMNLILNYVCIFFGIFTPETAILTTILATLLYNVVAIFYTKSKLSFLEVSFFTKRILGYTVIGLCFIPIAFAVKCFNLSYMMNIVLTVISCMGLYGGYLLITKDSIIYILAEKFHLMKLLNKIGIKF